MVPLQEQKGKPPWVRGTLISLLGVVVGTISFIVFCYAMGLNLSDEGWPEDHNPWQTNRWSLFGSFIGFGLSILIFWLGFVQTTERR